MVSLLLQSTSHRLAHKVSVPGRSSTTAVGVVGRRPAPLQRSQQHHSSICRAVDDSTPPGPQDQQQPAQQQQPEQQPQQPPAAPSAPLLAPGQGTAIVTGAISILFGIAYLVLVSLLDMRGGELQPPPPEAFME